MTFCNGYFLGRAGAEMLARFSECPYNHLQAIPLAWFHEHKRGLVLALRTNDIQRINGLSAIRANIYGEVQTARGAAERLLEVFEVQPEPYQEGKPAMPAVRGEVRFEDLYFRYPGRADLIKGLNLSVQVGEAIALTGSNGSGKSTLAHMLMRLIEPHRGRITIDGIDIAQVELTSLRRQIGLIDQNVLLLNGTVAENIGYGCSDASPEELEKTARAARAHEFISDLPQGYQTLIGDQGVKLSGGQKQRIALARALIKEPAILIMDEATSMFDPEGEREFIRDCRKVLRSSTVILITHRPESLKLADRIYRLEGGRLSEVEA